jgi:hypothetical protein
MRPPLVVLVLAQMRARAQKRRPALAEARAVELAGV